MKDTGSIYCAMICIVDFLALQKGLPKYMQDVLYEKLDRLLDIYTFINLTDIEDFKKERQDKFEGIADANDAGVADDWHEMVTIFKYHFVNGNRINLKDGTLCTETDGSELRTAVENIMAYIEEYPKDAFSNELNGICDMLLVVEANYLKR